jgi:hypothetical protein
LINKISIVSLSVKLVKAGCDEEAIADVTREHLIAMSAELVAAGKYKSYVKPSFYTDPETERQHLQFEMPKYQEAKQEQRCVRQKERLRREQIAGEAEKCREQAAAAAICWQQ